MTAAKLAIEELAVAHSLPIHPENSGSKFPKTTLGCLSREEDPPLSSEELSVLRGICHECQEHDDHERDVVFTAVEVVDYRSRSLEEISQVIAKPLAGAGAAAEPEPHDGSGLERVEEFSEQRHAEYLAKAQQAGGRVNHYRGPAQGLTLIARLKRIPKSITRFRERVDQRLPGRFTWFKDNSLHVTIRGLV